MTDEMSEFHKDLPHQVAASISDELTGQVNQTFDKVVETDWRLTQHNFLVNAGGAAATLAYLGSEPTPIFAVWPLCLFLTGVVASGIEIRTLLYTFSNLHKDAIRRRAGFAANDLAIRELGPPADVGGLATKINDWCGWIAQGSFVAGVITGIILFIKNAP